MGFTMVYVLYSAVLPLVSVDWNMSASRAGLIQTGFHMGFLCSLFTVGFLSDRFGAKRTYLISNLGAMASAVLFAMFARDFWSALLFYTLAGLLSGGSYTPVLTLLAQCFPPEKRGRAIGMYISSSQCGYALTLFLTSRAVLLGGWKLVFALTALGPVLGTVLGTAMVWRLPNRVVVRPPGDNTGGVVRDVLRNKGAMLCIWAYVAHSWEMLGFRAWLPAFLTFAFAAGQGSDLSAASLGAAFVGVTYLVSIAGPISGGALSDRLGRTRLIMLLGGISAVTALFFGWLSFVPFWILVTFALLFQFVSIADSPVHSTTLSELVPPQSLGAAYSLRSVLGFGAGAISPWVLGLVLDWGRNISTATEPIAWGLGFMTLGLGGLGAPLCAWWLSRTPFALKLAGGRG